MAQLLVAAAASWGGTAIAASAGVAATTTVAFGMTAGQLGWLAGSLVGSMLFQDNPAGPKIEQGKFSTNIYGSVIPLNYGKQRHATQVAWWSGLQIRTEGGGKKSGSYELARMDLLLAVCEGPQAAVPRIWANGRLIYDATVAGDPFIDSEVLPAGEIRVYLGTETQIADPTYEAAVTTDFAIPYRGTVMVAIDGLEGATFGNRPPNIEVEVCGSAATTGGSGDRIVVGSTIFYAPFSWSATGGALVADWIQVAPTGFTVWKLIGGAPTNFTINNPSDAYVEGYAVTTDAGGQAQVRDDADGVIGLSFPYRVTMKAVFGAGGPDADPVSWTLDGQASAVTPSQVQLWLGRTTAGVTTSLYDGAGVYLGGADISTTGLVSGDSHTLIAYVESDQITFSVDGVEIGTVVAPMPVDAAYLTMASDNASGYFDELRLENMASVTFTGDFSYTVVASADDMAGEYGWEPLLVAGDGVDAPLIWSMDMAYGVADTAWDTEGVVDRSNIASVPGFSGVTLGPLLGDAWDWVWDGTYIWAVKYSPSGLYRCNPTEPYDIQSYSMTVNNIFIDRDNNVWYSGSVRSTLNKLNKASPTSGPTATIVFPNTITINYGDFDDAGNFYTSGDDYNLFVNSAGGTYQAYALGVTYGVIFVTYIPPNNSVYAWTGGSTLGELIEFSCDSRTVIKQIHTTTSEIPPGNYANYGRPVFDPQTGYLWATGGGLKVKVIDTATGTILYNAAVPKYGTYNINVWGPAVVHPDGYVYVSASVSDPESEEVVLKMSYTPPTTTCSPVTLRSIVEDLCDRSGLAPANLDASAGTDLVSGFKIASQTSARAAIDSLRPVYFFDMPEKGEQIVMVKRGGDSVATIDSGELGASIFQVSGADNTTDYELDHTEEQEIPRRLEVTYVDAAANYDPGIQAAERQVGSALAPLHVEAPVVLTAAQAAKVAWANLLMAHSSKNRIRFNLTHHYDALIPSDPITIPHASGESLRVRIETITRARPLLEIEGVPEEQSVYTQVMGGTARYQGARQTSIGTIGDTLLVLLDVPPLRDVDNSLLVYSVVARDTYADSWPGASLYKSIDGGASYDTVYATTTGATIGTSTGALGDWTGGNIWDDTNTLTVVLTSGTFSSATDLGVLNGANGLAVKSGSDWEIVQFATATLVGTNTWELTRLLRGRHGTERCIAGHANGDTVVLLYSASMQTVAQTLGEVGAVRQYKGVTSGQAVADAASQNLTLAGRSLMPLAPVHIAGSRAGDDLTITWVRRVRIGAGFRAAVPLDEATESYSIDIMSGATVKRTLTSSTPTVTYTSAQQTTDFGSAQSAVAVRVYQLSATVGRGHPGEATV